MLEYAILMHNYTYNFLTMKICNVKLTSQMRFSNVCTLIDRKYTHSGGQNVADSGDAILTFITL